MSDARAALERLIEVARSDTGQSRKVANFLLAWWNAKECGGFDLMDVWGVDPPIAADMLAVFALLTRRQQYPEAMGIASSSRLSCVCGGQLRRRKTYHRRYGTGPHD